MIPPALPPPPVLPASLILYVSLIALATVPMLVIYYAMAPVMLPERATTAMVWAGVAIVWQLALVVRWPHLPLIIPFLVPIWVSIGRRLLKATGTRHWVQEIEHPTEALLIAQGLAFLWLLWNHPTQSFLMAGWAGLALEGTLFLGWESAVYAMDFRHNLKRTIGVEPEPKLKLSTPPAGKSPVIQASNRSLGPERRTDTAEEIHAKDRRAPKTPFGEL